MKPSRALARIRHLVLTGEWRLTEHAALEADDDDLHRVDIESAVLTGTILRVERDDPRGAKYVMVGLAVDLERKVTVVAQLLANSRCVIITVYEVRKA